MAVIEHPTSFIGVMNTQGEYKPAAARRAAAQKSKRAKKG
jgi:hypothetical protein